MTSIQLFSEIFALSLCSWGLYAFYNTYRIRKFIIKRYENETQLLETIYFKRHAVFTRYLPPFFSAPMYSAHLITFVWGWDYFRKRKAYTDIKDASFVTRHFSTKEIRRVKQFWINGGVLVSHALIYYTLRLFWPEFLK